MDQEVQASCLAFVQVLPEDLEALGAEGHRVRLVLADVDLRQVLKVGVGCCHSLWRT